MTAGAAAFRSVVGIFVSLLILFGIKEAIFNFYPLLENMSPEADWWNPFIDKSIAKILYPNEPVETAIIGFWAITIGFAIATIQGIIGLAQETK